MTELLACPFCGGAASRDIDRRSFSIGCEDCGIATVYNDSFEQAMREWNSRAPLPSVLPIPAPDPRYDARCALQDRTDWSAE